jgi:hypothetical protein
MFFNKDKQLETRRGFRKFWPRIGNAPITSYFFFQKDDGTGQMAICSSGTQMYKYDPTGNTWNSIRTGLTEFETNPLMTGQRTRRDYAVYKNIIYMCNGVNNYASYDGTTYTEYAAQPKVRYVSQLTDRIFGAGDDTNPISLYYTAAAPANGNTINTNVVVVWGDENGKINGIGELWQIILGFKSNKIYSINVTALSALPLDAQSGWYSDRSINNVWNSIVFFNESGIDTLQQRTGATGSQALESKPLSNDLRSLIDKITELQYNSCAWWYIKKYNNYYFAFDTNNDNIPDTILVYNSLVGAFTQYELPNLYDFGFYINAQQQYQFLFTSASDGQVYEFEYGFDDDGEKIVYEIQTKNFDFNEPWTYKTFDYVDIIGKKTLNFSIEAKIITDGEVVSGGDITDSNVKLNSTSYALSLQPLSLDPLSWPIDDSGERLYDFTIRIPLYTTGTDIAINLSSLWWQWIVEQMRIWVRGEPIDVFGYWSIL